MKIVIVNCFDTYEQRIDLVYDYFIGKGHDVSVIQSDFRHFQKVKRTDHKTGFTFVEALPYYKNMSLSRLISHYRFAKKAFDLVETLQPDLLYVMLPPNSLAKFAAQYKRMHKNVKLYFDLIDLWPETMPVGKVKTLPPFTSWQRLRDKNLKAADVVITECNLYQTILKGVLKDIKTETIYLARRASEIDIKPVFDEDKIHLCYLGSINNIIDITTIAKLVRAINARKPVVLHIIGDGENKDTLINEVKDTGAKVEYYGKVYDAKEKQQIFDQCQFGLNIMKETVCVGLTMKSIDYFGAGLPILNNIKHDTWNIVEKHNVGFNISISNLEEVGVKVASMTFDMLKLNAKQVFKQYFSSEVFIERMNEVMGELSINR